MRSTGKSRRLAASAKSRRRLPRNRRRFNFRRLVWPLAAVAILSGSGVGCYYLLTAPALRVNRIEVLGTHLLDRTAIEADAKPALGKNILLISKKQLAARIARHPELKSVSIGRALPRKIVVRVAERVPYLTAASGTGLWLVDSAGLPFHEVKRAPESIPLVEFPPEVRIISGRPVRHVSMKSAILCVRQCRAAGHRVSKISVDRAGNLCLNIGSRFYVKLGQPVEIPKKLANLSRILSAQPEIGEKAQYIDLSCSDRPAWRPKPDADGRPISNT